MAQGKTVELSKHETDVLLGLYSGCECLWNMKNPDYKVKGIRIGAIRTIINGMRLETGNDFTTSQIQTALDNIRHKYTQELQLVLNGEKSSENSYKSQWRWFHFLDSFLRDNVLHSQKTKTEVESGKEDSLSGALTADDGNDTDDYYCTALDSGDDDSRLSATKNKVQLQVLPSQSRMPASSPSSRPVRMSSRRFSVSALVNGTSHSAGQLTADTHSSKKRRRETGVSPASSSRNSVTSAAGASGSNTSFSRHISSTSGGNASFSRHSGSSISSMLKDAKTVRGQALVESTQRTQTDSLHISSQIADTLKAVQILLATSLTDQDQPAMVFARHIANELQQIADYVQRKQCMLDIQQVIMRYQTKQQPTGTPDIKFERRCGEPLDEEVTETGDNVVRGMGDAATATTSQPQCTEESLLLYFDTP